jgi:hypothetical protein
MNRHNFFIKVVKLTDGIKYTEFLARSVHSLQNKTTSSCRPSGFYNDVHEEFYLSTYYTLVSCSAFSSTLKMETIYSAETSVEFQRTKRRYISEGRTHS